MPPTVVIVDDHEPFRRSARSLLELDGYRVVGEAGDGAAAIELVDAPAAGRRPARYRAARRERPGPRRAARGRADARRARVEPRPRRHRPAASGAVALRASSPRTSCRARRCAALRPERREDGCSSRSASRGAALGVFAYRLLRDDSHQSVIRSLPAVAIGWSAIASGLIAWRQRPANRLGPLMMAYGLAVLVRPWQYSGDALVFTIGYALSQLNAALFGHSTLAYPTGRVTDRLELWLVRLAYAVALVVPARDVARLRRRRAALHPARPGERPARCTPIPGSPARSTVRSSSAATGSWPRASSRSSSASSSRATPRMRRVLAPLLLAAVIAGAARAHRGPRRCSRARRTRSPRGLVLVAGRRADPAPDRLARRPPAGAPRAGAGGRAARRARSHAARGDPRRSRPPSRRPEPRALFWLPERDAYVDASGAIGRASRAGITRSLRDGDRARRRADRRDRPRPVPRRGAASSSQVGRRTPRASRSRTPGCTPRCGRSSSRCRSRAGGSSRRETSNAAGSSGTSTTGPSSGSSRSRSSCGRRSGASARTCRPGRRARCSPAPSRSSRSPSPSSASWPAASIRRSSPRTGSPGALESLAARTPLHVTVEARARRAPARPRSRRPRYFVACEALANAVKHADASACQDQRRAGARHARGRGRRRRTRRRRPGRHGPARASPTASRRTAAGSTSSSPAGGGTRVVGEIPCAS